MTNAIYSSSVMIMAKHEIEVLNNEMELSNTFNIQDLAKVIVMIIYIILLMDAFVKTRLDEILCINQKPQLLIENL